MKELILKAIQKLIATYADDSIRHSLERCPLCSAFSSKDTDGDFKKWVNGTCGCCPNLIFHPLVLNEFNRGCVERGIVFPLLDYRNRENNNNLSQYWQDVYNILILQSEEDIILMPKELSKQLLKIAKSVNKQCLTKQGLCKYHVKYIKKL